MLSTGGNYGSERRHMFGFTLQGCLNFAKLHSYALIYIVHLPHGTSCRCRPLRMHNIILAVDCILDSMEGCCHRSSVAWSRIVAVATEARFAGA